MAESDDVRIETPPRVFEEPVACGARRILQRAPLGTRSSGHILPVRKEGPSEARRDLAAERFVSGCRTPQLVIQVGDACDLEHSASRELGQQVGEGDRVGPARHCDEDTSLRAREFMVANGRADAVDQLHGVTAGQAGWVRGLERQGGKGRSGCRAHPDLTRPSCLCLTTQRMPEDGLEPSTPRL